MSEPRIINADGRPIEPDAESDQTTSDQADGSGPTALTDLVAQPAKVMRIGGMIRQLLDEVKSAPLDVESRARLRDIYEQSIAELKDGLAPELVDELDRLSLPFDAAAPTEAELRIAQAQLVGWLEGLFHGIQAALYAQQVQAQHQFQNMRLALPDGTTVTDAIDSSQKPENNGMYL